MTDTPRLRGETFDGEVVEFNLDDIHSVVKVIDPREDYQLVIINPVTIQLAYDPRKASDKQVFEWAERHNIRFGITDLRCAFEDAQSFEEMELADDPRKRMFDKIREKLLNPVSVLPDNMTLFTPQMVAKILDEMKAKL